MPKRTAEELAARAEKKAAKAARLEKKAAKAARKAEKEKATAALGEKEKATGTRRSPRLAPATHALPPPGSCVRRPVSKPARAAQARAPPLLRVEHGRRPFIARRNSAAARTIAPRRAAAAPPAGRTPDAAFSFHNRTYRNSVPPLPKRRKSRLSAPAAA